MANIAGYRAVVEAAKETSQSHGPDGVAPFDRCLQRGVVGRANDGEGVHHQWRGEG